MADAKISALAALVTPDNADVLPIVDDSATQTKKITYANLKSAITAGLSSAWGGITGTLSAQTDLQSALDAKQNLSGKDATGGYAGLTLFKINFKNAANTFTSFFTNANTAARTYTFQNRDGTIADDTDLALKAPIASPTFTGTPISTTPSQADNSTKIATTAYVDVRTGLKAEITLTDGATITWDFSLGYNAKVTLAGNRTLAFSNAVAGTYGTLKVIQDGTGSRTLALPASSKAINGGSGAVSLTTTASAIDILTFYYDGTTYFWNSGLNYT